MAKSEYEASDKVITVLVPARTDVGVVAPAHPPALKALRKVSINIYDIETGLFVCILNVPAGKFAEARAIVAALDDEVAEEITASTDAVIAEQFPMYEIRKAEVDDEIANADETEAARVKRVGPSNIKRAGEGE